MRTMLLLALSILLLLVPAQAESLARLEVTAAEMTGPVDVVGAFDGLLHGSGEGRNRTDLSFELDAARIDIEEDRSMVVASAAGVVTPAPASESTERIVHRNASLGSLDHRANHLLAVFPQGHVAARIASDHALMLPATGDLTAQSFVRPSREAPTVDIRDAVRIDLEGGEVVLKGDLLIVVWDWDLQVRDSEGTHLYTTGQSSQPVARSAPLGTGEMVQLFIHATDAKLRMDLPGNISSLHLAGAHAGGIENLHLERATGVLGPYSLTSDPVVLEGQDLGLQVGSGGADQFPATLHGDYALATIGQDSFLLGAVPDHQSRSPVTWMAALGVALVGIAVCMIIAARIGKRGPYHSRWLNLSDRAFDRGWGHLTLWLASIHLWRHRDCADGWKMRTDALHRLGRQEVEVAARERSAHLFEAPHDLHNAMRLVILHGALSRPEDALVWLQVCRQIDPASVQRLAMEPAGMQLGRNRRFRAGVGRVLGLDSIVGA